MRHYNILFLTLFLISSILGSDLKLQGPITVSGLSSGAFMAAQMHIAFSDTIKGAAIFAGGPYYCAQGSMITATTTCMSTGLIQVDTLLSKVKSYSTSKSIDDYSKVQGSKVFILDGTNDRTVIPKVGKAGEELYSKLGADIKTEYTLNAGHGMPTLSFGTACSSTASPFINNCNYDGAYIALNYLYGGELLKGTKADTKRIMKISQTAAAGSSLDSTAYAYVPTACSSGGCAVHIVYHGCQQTTANIQMKYVESTGYNEVAEANGFVILYPQVKSSMFMPSNPNGCWDWWGYTNANYVTKSGVQMKESMRLATGLQLGLLEMAPAYENIESVLKNLSE